MDQKDKKTIYNYINLARHCKVDYLIILIMNVKELTPKAHDYCGDSVISEYYSYEQYKDILYSLIDNGYHVKSYFDENDFISDFEMGIIRNNYPRRLLVLNFSQKGIGVGRKSLIPAFCQMNGILYSGSNPYIVSFARSKYHWNCLLQMQGYSVPKSWLYMCKYGFANNFHPPLGCTVIIKLNSESSSIGLSSANIVTFSDETNNLLIEMTKKYQQDLIIEEFVEGREVEVPILIGNEPIALDPAGISIKGEHVLGNRILDYKIRGTHSFEHYLLKDDLSSLSIELAQTSKMVARIMQLKTFGRVDYRISNEGKFYITDIATNPHITKSMTFWFDMEKDGFAYHNLIESIIGLTIGEKNNESTYMP